MSEPHSEATGDNLDELNAGIYTNGLAHHLLGFLYCQGGDMAPEGEAAFQEFERGTISQQELITKLERYTGANRLTLFIYRHIISYHHR